MSVWLVGALIWLVFQRFTASPGSFPSCSGENHPNLKSGGEVDPDKLACTMSCRGDETDPAFSSVLFLDFGP